MMETLIKNQILDSDKTVSSLAVMLVERHRRFFRDATPLEAIEAASQFPADYGTSDRQWNMGINASPLARSVTTAIERGIINPVSRSTEDLIS